MGGVRDSEEQKFVVGCWRFPSVDFLSLSSVLLPCLGPPWAARPFLIPSIFSSDVVKRHGLALRLFRPFPCSTKPSDPFVQDASITRFVVPHTFRPSARIPPWLIPPLQLVEEGRALVPEETFPDGCCSGGLGGAGTEVGVEEDRVRQSLGRLIDDDRHDE